MNIIAVENRSQTPLMTVDQSAILCRKRNELLIKFLLLAAITGACSLWAVLQAQNSGQVGYYIVALGIFISTAFTTLDVVDLLLAIQQDLKLNQIALAQGRVKAQSTYLYDMLVGQHTVSIGNGRYKLPHKSKAFTVEYCRVIYAPTSRIVLGVEE